MLLKSINHSRKAVLLCSLAMVGCQTSQKQETQEQADARRKERGGTAIGAASGAAVGAAIGKGNTRGRNAIIGGVLGGIAGNRIGAYMDSQEEEFKETLDGTGVSVERNGDRIELKMPGDVTFATGKSNIQSEFEPVLASVSEVLKKYPETVIQVQGHTDSTGSNQFNQTLSQQRAQSVAAFLERHEVNRARIKTVGYGESQPVASNDNADGRRQNRRVELELIPVVAQAD